MAADLNAVHLALRARAKPALPAYREYENVVPAAVPATEAYSEEDFIPATTRLRSVNTVDGVTESTGLYVLRWFGVAGDGTAAMNAGITALLNRFPMGLAITATDGTKVCVRRDHGPYRGQIINLDNGRPVATVTIPYEFYSTNTF